MSADLRIQAGGTLNPRRHLYIERTQDAELLRLLLVCEYVNVLTSRQMGKSSLMVRTLYQLHEHGVRYVTIDLASELGSSADLDSYYRGLLGKIVRELGVKLDLMTWWEEHKTETVNQRLLRFFREVVGGSIAEPVVIFLDEIDSTLRLSYTDDLFTAIRGMYNERALTDAFAKVTFCLLGVATPNELIKDRRTTAYNVGVNLDLRDFERGADDLLPLAAALNKDTELGERLLDRVLHWTGGHPYLTTKLCADLARNGVGDPHAIDEHVERAFASLDGVSGDVHFQQILRFLAERLSDEAATIELYAKLLKGERVRDQTSLAHAELKLSGLVKREGEGFLSVRNPIYRRLFDMAWVESTRPSRTAAVYRQRYIAAVRVIAAALVATLIVGGYWQFEEWRYQAALAALVEEDIQVSEGRGGITEKIKFPDGTTQVLLDNMVVHIKSLDMVRELDLSGTQITNVTALQDLTNLQQLNLIRTQVADVTPLQGLTKLQQLNLWSTRVTDVTPLQELTMLQVLNLGSTQVADVAALQGLTNLQQLDLSGTQVADVAALEGLKNLQRLVLRGTRRVTDVTALKGLTNLQRLDLQHTQVADVTALEDLKNLQSLLINATQVTDVTALKGLINLKWLYLGDTQIADVAALQGLKNLQRLSLRGTRRVADVTALQGLTNLRQLDLSGTQVTNVTALQDLTNLQQLNLIRTQVADVTALQGLTNLQSLYLGDTQVADVTALQGLTNLQSLYLNGTQVADVTALQGLTNLRQLNLGGTQVADVTALKGLTKLRTLDLSSTQVADVTALQGLKNLKMLRLQGAPVSEEDLTRLKEILRKTSINTR